MSGNVLYQRRGVDISFAAKKQLDERATLVTVKVNIPVGDSLARHVHRLHTLVEQGRATQERPFDTELRWLVEAPRSVVRAVMGLARWLDARNALPSAFTRDDPMFASMFLANLGSVGLDAAYHHLYEYGTISLFGTVGKVKKALVRDPSGESRVSDVVDVRWTFDERINDGYYCAAALERLRDYIENPGAPRKPPVPLRPAPRPAPLQATATREVVDPRDRRATSTIGTGGS